jgi:putative ABC transport system permease protein
VLFVAGLFLATFDNLLDRPLGFAHERVLLLETQVRGPSQPPQVWTEVRDRLSTVPGVESVALSMWAPLSRNRWLASVRVPGRDIKSPAPYALGVSPGFFDTMGIGMIAGRDFRASDRPPTVKQGAQTTPGVGIVSETFARIYFDRGNPIGAQVTMRQDGGGFALMEIVGLVRDVAYWSVREPMQPTVYVPTDDRSQGALVIRTAGDPLTLAPALRAEVTRARPDFRVTNASTQSALVGREMIRERLLATLSLFFAFVALALAGIGLYGVLNYAVIRRRREIGVRMALGARAGHVVKRVVAEMLSPVAVGAIIGLAGGLAFGRLVEALLFEVSVTGATTVASPVAALLAATILAALPPAIRAVRIDPARILRSE